MLTLIILILTSPAFGQWTIQTITLQPGWNAVYLEVKPLPEECDQIFKDIPINSVWSWNRQFSSVQFIENMSELVPERPEWLTYFPKSTGKSFLSNLYTIQGGKAYLIKLDSTEPITLNIKGIAALPAYKWMSDSFNLVGFHVNSNDAPTVKQFFSHSEAHKDQPVYHLNESGTWELLSQDKPILPGKAYWVYCSGYSTYKGTCQPILEQGKGLHFGKILNEQTLRIKNETSSENRVQLKLESSVTPPEHVKRAAVVSPILTYWKADEFRWVNFTDPLTINLQPHSEMAVRLGIKRKITSRSSETSFQGILNITDNQGTRFTVPVSAESLSVNRSGLWTGMAAINMVSCPTDDSPTKTSATASEFQMRLIVHVDEEGQARLLQQVTLLWKSGTFTSSSEYSDYSVVDQPGEYVLITNDALLSEYSGAAIRDNKQVGRRISSAAFAFSEPIPMIGKIGSSLNCTTSLDYNHPLNPFKHKYHPGHDNLDYDFTRLHPNGKESYTITRDIQLTFSDETPEGEISNGWGDNILGGVYQETIMGVHKAKLFVKGTFRLELISRISSLNGE
jgi:hypothetical protein